MRAQDVKVLRQPGEKELLGEDLQARDTKTLTCMRVGMCACFLYAYVCVGVCLVRRLGVPGALAMRPSVQASEQPPLNARLVNSPAAQDG